MYVFAATFWTFDVAFFVFRKSKDYFKWLLAIFAVELIARHGDLRKNARAAGLLIYGVRSRIAGVKAKQLSGRRSVSGKRCVYQALAKLNGLDESHSRYPHHCQRGNRPPQSTKRRPYARRAEGSLVCMDAVCGDLNFTNPTEGE